MAFLAPELRPEECDESLSVELFGLVSDEPDDLLHSISFVLVTGRAVVPASRIRRDADDAPVFSAPLTLMGSSLWILSTAG